MMRYLFNSMLFLSVVVLGVSVEALVPQVYACPMCKAALEEDDAKPLAYQTSILFMLSMPAAICGTLGFVLFRLNNSETRLVENAAPHA